MLGWVAGQMQSNGSRPRAAPRWHDVGESEIDWRQRSTWHANSKLAVGTQVITSGAHQAPGR
jgi:hypothetical protein